MRKLYVILSKAIAKSPGVHLAGRSGGYYLPGCMNCGVSSRQESNLLVSSATNSFAERHHLDGFTRGMPAPLGRHSIKTCAQLCFGDA